MTDSLEQVREKYLNSYTSEISNYFKLYVDLFEDFPQEYCIGFDRESYVDIMSIDKKMIDKLYPNSLVSITKVKVPTEPTSCIEDEEDDDDFIYEYWMLGRHYSMSICIVCPKKKLLVRLSEIGIVFYHTPNFDCEAEKERVLKVLPKKPIRPVDSKRGKVQLVCNDGEGFYTIESRINKMDIDIDKQYNDDFKPVCKDIEKFLDKENRRSGIVILNGPPGTGKTTYIRHLITTVPGNYIIINNIMGARISSSEFVSFLMAHKDSIFILEDCEGVVMDRQITGFTNAVAAILNMADGLMSDIFNGKFICTFNTDISKVDPALLRRGRCFGKYEFKRLDGKKAEALLKERGFDVHNCGDMTLADIYNYENTTIEETQTQKKIGF
jgi:hypothetical protein